VFSSTCEKELVQDSLLLHVQTDEDVVDDGEEEEDEEDKG